MGNLTIAIDEVSLKKARMRALQEGTSVNAILQDFLESYAGSKRERQDAVKDVLAISRASKTRRGGGDVGPAMNFMNEADAHFFRHQHFRISF